MGPYASEGENIMTCELIQPLDMGAWAETKVVRAGELRYGDASGWIIVGQF